MPFVSHRTVQRMANRARFLFSHTLPLRILSLYLRFIFMQYICVVYHIEYIC